MNPTALDIRDVTKRYRRYAHRRQFSTLKSALLGGSLTRDLNPAEVLTAVDHVSLRVPRGATFGIIGRNGSGKSTLLKLVAGMLRPASGCVLVSDIDVASVPVRRRARAIALVPQSLERLPEVRVCDFVLGGRYSHLGRFGTARRADHEAVARAMSEADVSAWGHRSAQKVMAVINGFIRPSGYLPILA